MVKGAGSTPFSTVITIEDQMTDLISENSIISG
jgi:hypothetical protein